MRSRWTRRRFVGAAAKTSAAVVAPGWTLGCSRQPAPAAQDVHADDSVVLQHFAYLLFPFPEVGPEPYQRVAAVIEAAARADASTATLVSAGIAALDAAADRPWLEADGSSQLAILESIDGDPFFNYVFDTTKAQLFNDRTIWAHIGFDSNAPVNDIDWLGDE